MLSSLSIQKWEKIEKKIINENVITVEKSGKSHFFVKLGTWNFHKLFKKEIGLE